MKDELGTARKTAIGVAFNATHIVGKYRDESAWLQRDTLVLPALEFGEFLRDVNQAAEAVRAVSGLLIEAKDGTAPVEYAGIAEVTAHHVAVAYARKVAWSIQSCLFRIEGEQFIGNASPPSQETVDGALLAEHWGDVRESLSRVDALDFWRIRAEIQAESAKAAAADPRDAAAQAPADGNPEGADEPGAKPEADDDREWIFASEALARLSFLAGNYKGLLKWSADNPGKLRMRRDPNHERRRQVRASDVLRLEMEHEAEQFAAMDSPAGEQPPVPFSNDGIMELAKRIQGQQQQRTTRRK